LRSKTDKPEFSGLIILFIGVGLLVFTFLNAYWLLVEDISIISTHDLVGAFGEALAPLVATCIHVMYLGIMGWIGSLLTLRGIPLLTRPKTIVSQPMPATTAPVKEVKPVKKEQKEKPKQEKIEKPRLPEKPETKPETKPAEEVKKEEPEITIEVRPPEEVTVETPAPAPSSQEAPREQPSQQPHPQPPQEQPQE